MKKILSMVVVALVLATALVLPLQAQSGVTVFSNLRLTNSLRLQPRTTVTVTSGMVVETTGSYQRITSAAASGGSIDIRPAGTVLTLVNVGSNTITFTETGTLISAGNIVLGANDSATLYSDGTNWYQVGASNN